jgi:hypothetical protein
MSGTLHILKSKPDKATKTLLSTIGAWTSSDNKVFHLYETNPDYEELLDLLFKYDRAICWW